MGSCPVRPYDEASGCGVDYGHGRMGEEKLLDVSFWKSDFSFI